MKKLQILGLSILFLVISCTSCYSPRYTYRVLIYQDSDYNDGEKFKQAKIAKAKEKFSFKASEEAQSKRAYTKFSNLLEGKDLDGFLQDRGTHSFLVIRNDTLLIEKYFLGSNSATLQNTFSVSKSILSLAIAKAIELGFIKNLDEAISIYIPELSDRDSNFDKISIGDLLHMKSGIKYDPDTGFPWLNKDNPLTYYHPDLRKIALSKTKIVEEPDKNFNYNNYNPLLLGLIMERATKMTLSQFVEKYFWTQIGSAFDAQWSTDEKAFEKMESGFMATAIDQAKIGKLILEKGSFNGKQIIAEDILKEFISTNTSMEVFNNRVWGYGKFWWTLPDKSTNPSIMANGHMGQFIFINPKTNYIIIRNGLKTGKFYDDDWAEIFNSYTNK